MAWQGRGRREGGEREGGGRKGKARGKDGCNVTFAFDATGEMREGGREGGGREARRKTVVYAPLRRRAVGGLKGIWER